MNCKSCYFRQSDIVPDYLDQVPICWCAAKGCIVSAERRGCKKYTDKEKGQW